MTDKFWLFAEIVGTCGCLWGVWRLRPQRRNEWLMCGWPPWWAFPAGVVACWVVLFVQFLIEKSMAALDKLALAAALRAVERAAREEPRAEVERR